MDYEFQLHPPPSLLPDAKNPWEDPVSIIWKLENTAWGEHRDLWGWSTPCQKCGEEASLFSKETGYLCRACSRTLSQHQG